MRVLLALGGNAMTNPDGRARPQDQIAAAAVAADAVADLVAQGVEVVITHGNGPQVGNLLVKNELAAAVVPPVPLDWCGAQTQATLGFVLMNALDAALRARGVDRRTAAVVTRTRVAADDRGFTHPSKPIGRHLTEEEAQVLIEHGETWEDRGEKGWRRMVASPEPLEIVDAPAIVALVDSGFVVIANGGGGIPVVLRADSALGHVLGGVLGGVEAVIDKDLGAALLADTVEADVLVIATDVSPGGAALRHARRQPDRPDLRDRAPCARPRRALRQRLDGPQGGRGLPVRGAWWDPSRDHQPGQHRRRGVRGLRHRRRTRAKPTNRPTLRSALTCPTPSKYARSRSTRSRTPASSPR